MITTRVDKLKFIVEEMQIAFHLTAHLTNPFDARTLARHILIRAENFIEHARGLRRPLKDAGYNTHEFHTTKEIYATEFEEYFKTSRHRLGAHVQDFDFGKRIELWNDIEIIKIGFFVDGALEIYRSLELLKLPGYVGYITPIELTNPTILESINQYQHTIEKRTGVEIGTDPLAMTRNKTTAILNTTPIHERAGQLALIRRWITMQCDLLERLSAHSRVVHMLKARIITDYVSFCDCLVTRSVKHGALQEMEGLDKLIDASDQASVTLKDFIVATNFQDELQAARAVRDIIGAHLEINTTHTVESLLVQLDAYNFPQGLRFYNRVAAAFNNVCRNTLYLRMYIADGERIYGISAAHTPAEPYAGIYTEPLATPLKPPEINEDEAYHENLTLWLDDADGEARHFFWQAFLNSKVVEIIEEIESTGSSQHIFQIEFRKAHQFLSSALSHELSDSDFRGSLELILSCSRGHPYPLAEVLVRYGQNASAYRKWLICYVLGEIGSTPHKSVFEFLEACSHSTSWRIRLRAKLAHFKTFVKAEGIYRANHKGQKKLDYGTLVQSLTKPLSEPERIIFLLAISSILSSSKFDVFSRPFRDHYSILQDQIETLCLPFLIDDAMTSKAAALKRLIQANDYISVCLLIALELNESDHSSLRTKLIDSCCDESIVPAGHDQSTYNLAMCFLLNKDYHRAFEIAEGLASRNPDWLDIQIFAAEILGDIPGAEGLARQKIANLLHAYKLTSDIKKRITAIEIVIAKRLASS